MWMVIPVLDSVTHKYRNFPCITCTFFTVFHQFWGVYVITEKWCTSPAADFPGFSCALFTKTRFFKAFFWSTRGVHYTRVRIIHECALYMSSRYTPNITVVDSGTPLSWDTQTDDSPWSTLAID